MGRRMVGVAVAFACLAMVALPVTARAYSLEGPRWPGQPSPGTCCANIYYRNVSVYSTDTIGWSHGATAWNYSAAYVFLNTSATGTIYAGDEDNSSVSWDGLTTYSWYYGGNGIKYFYSGTAATLNYYYTRNYSQNETQSVSTHEFGHALGLGHVSTCVIMNPSTPVRFGTCGVYTPRTDDDNGIDALY